VQRRLAELLLARQSSEQNAMVKYGPTALTFIHNQVILQGNRYLKEMFGWEPKDYIGHSTEVLYPCPEACEKVTKTALEYLDAQRQDWITVEFMCKDGTIFPARFRGAWIDLQDREAGRF
jgi:PAS domain S-box-containing protein